MLGVVARLVRDTRPRIFDVPDPPRVGRDAVEDPEALRRRRGQRALYELGEILVRQQGRELARAARAALGVDRADAQADDRQVVQLGVHAPGRLTERLADAVRPVG